MTSASHVEEPKTPTDEQTNILDLVRTSDDNLMINALAGTGKTSTLEMIELAVPSQPILYLVFNTKNAKEAEGKMLSTTTVKTVNGMGHSIWAQGRSISLNKNKTAEILREIIQALPKRDQWPIWESYWPIIQGVAMAKALGYVPEGVYPTAKRLCTQGDLHAALDEAPDDLTSDLIDTVLTTSIRQAYAGLIDFNDQIYMPALFGGAYPRFPIVEIDEYQDHNPVSHALFDKLARNRLIGVGDPWQNIYGFRGAKQGGMAEAQKKFQMKSCDLSTSFRCPKAVVEAARWRVPHFKWIKEGGHVESLNRIHHSAISDSATIICRNNAPLFKVALHLLSNKRSVSVAGSDIGPKLVAVMKKIGPEAMSKASFLSAINDWHQEKLSKESKTADDMAACMRVFAGFGETKAQALSYVEHLFKQDGQIKLLTGHKAKGLEFDEVYFLDPWLCRDDEQDQNLRYVIQTRSKNKLFEIDSRNIQW
jgi:superfamily I DNA/RNA helicase